MNLFRYFRLRAAQQVLCFSYSLPVVVLLTAALSPFGTFSGSLFCALFVTLMVLIWGGLALYTRETDRLRHLADSPEVVVSRGKTLVGIVKQHEKAQMVWEVLQDDELIRSHLRAWWRTVARFINGAFICLPAVILMSSWLVFWSAPEAGVWLVEHLRKSPPESLVGWMAGGLTSLYLITGLLWVMVYFVMNLPANGFREAFLAKVLAHQQRRNEPPPGGAEDAHTPAGGNAEEQKGDPE